MPCRRRPSDLGSDADVDPDVTATDLPALSWSERGRLLAAMAAGGMLGGMARHGVQQLWPHGVGTADWAIVVVNVTGCALLGVLMGLVESRRVRHPLIRPFLGVGLCGGFTTFSASLLDTERLLDSGRVAAAAGQLSVTLVASTGALVLALAGTLRVVSHRGAP